MAALRYCRGKAGIVLSVMNALESSIARESDLALQIWAGPEISVASTKAFTCQLLVMAALALEAAHQIRAQAADVLERYLAQLRQVPEQVAAALDCEADVRRVAQKLAPHDALFDKSTSNMQEVMARCGKIAMVSCASGQAAPGEVWETVPMAPVAGPFAAIAYAVPVQLLAYYTAMEKGTDVDQPRNLAKSVTVE